MLTTYKVKSTDSYASLPQGTLQLNKGIPLSTGQVIKVPTFNPSNITASQYTAMRGIKPAPTGSIYVPPGASYFKNIAGSSSNFTRNIGRPGVGQVVSPTIVPTLSNTAGSFANFTRNPNAAQPRSRLYYQDQLRPGLVNSTLPAPFFVPPVTAVDGGGGGGYGSGGGYGGGGGYVQPPEKPFVGIIDTAVTWNVG